MKPTTRSMFLRLNCLLVTAALSSFAHADTFTWTNLVSGNATGSWATQGNWSGGTLPTTINDTADFSTLDITAASTVSLNGNQSINKMLFADATTASNDWTIAPGTPSSSTLTLGGTAPEISVTNRTAIITAQMTGSTNWTKKGAGTLRLTNTSNNFSGDITVQTGVLDAHRGSLGTTAGKTYINSTGSTSTGGQLTINQNGVLYNESEDVVIQGAGNNSSGAGTAALRFGGSAGSDSTFSNMNGSITLDGNANYKIDVYLQPTHWKINGGITRTGTNTGTLFLDLSHYQVTTPVRLTINSTIDNNGGAVTLFGNTAGILQMDAAGHDVGDFTVNGEQTATYQTILKLGINDALVTNKNLTLTKGTFDLAGFNQTVNALSGVVNVSSITNSSASASTLTVGNGGGTSTYAGTISSGSGTLKLVKSGAGTITLTGANSYNENSVEGGILVIGNVNQGTGSQANNIASGATLRLTSGNGFTSDMSFAGAGTLELNGPIFTWGAKVGTFAMDSESLIKVTSGTFWTNSGAGAEIWTNNKSDLDIASGAIVNVITGETRVDSLTGSGTVEGGFGATGSLLTVGVDNGSGTFSGTVTNYANAGAAGHIAKEGSGTQVLSGTLSYSGDTTVKGGTLTLKQINTSNESSTVTIAAGAKLGLDFEGSDTVDKLFLGTPAVQISPGTYSASHPTYGSYFENGGSLIVTNGPEAPVAGFSSWISGTFANGTVDAGQQGANDDPDGDGISNLLEYAVLDQDPTVANPSVGTLTGKTLSFSKRADASGLTYEIEKSSDLGISDPWTVVTPTVNDASTISYTLPDGPAKNFQRLKITQE